MKESILNNLRDEAYQIAVDHGWHQKPMSIEHYLCLVISELMEAVEADRKGMYLRKKIDIEENELFVQDFEIYVKGRVEEELADAVIRLLDLYGYRNIDVRCKDVELVEDCTMFTEHVFWICQALTDWCWVVVDLESMLNRAVSYIFTYCEEHGIDLMWCIQAKIKYNKQRDYKHGNKKY